MTDAMREALKPCPFCGGEAEIVHIEEGENQGGSCVCCTRCMASGNVEFDFKENFVSNWNRRAFPAPTPDKPVLPVWEELVGMQARTIASPVPASGTPEPVPAWAGERHETGFHLDRLNAWLTDLWAAKSIDLHMCDGSRRENQFGLLRDIRDDVAALRAATLWLAPPPASPAPQEPATFTAKSTTAAGGE